MTTDIITIKNVRGYIDEQGTAWINAEDAARGLGFTETAASGNVTIRWRTVRNYLESFGYQSVATSCDEINAGAYIPENMFYRLAMKAKNEAAEKFQAIVADEILPTLRKTGTYSIKAKAPTPVADAFKDARAFADEIQAEFIGVKRGIAISKAIDVAEHLHNVTLQTLKELIPPATHDTGYLNATQIGERLGLGTGTVAGRRANVLLKSADFQRKEGRDWRLTEDGLIYGEEMPYTRNGHSGYQIRWNENVIEALNDVAL